MLDQAQGCSRENAAANALLEGSFREPYVLPVVRDGPEPALNPSSTSSALAAASASLPTTTRTSPWA